MSSDTDKPKWDVQHLQAVNAAQQLQSMTGRSDLADTIFEELVRKNTKLNELEIQLAKAVVVPLWKKLWGKIKSKVVKGNPSAD